MNCIINSKNQLNKFSNDALLGNKKHTYNKFNHGFVNSCYYIPSFSNVKTYFEKRWWVIEEIELYESSVETKTQTHNDQDKKLRLG